MRRRMAALSALLLVAGLFPAYAAGIVSAAPPGSATVVPLQVTGPPAERMNLVIMGDGYTEAELPQFRADVDRHLNILWSIDPFRSYRNYFNIYMLEIVSQDSGISCDPDDGNVRRNTPLRLNFANTCPADILARGITYGPALQSGTCPQVLGDPRCSGTQQHNLYLSTYLTPLGVSGQNVQTLAIANTFTYGGIGGTQATTSGQSPQGPLITPHELGHSLGTMADEYPYSSRPTPGGPAPNSEPSQFHFTRMNEADMVANQTKWWRWMCEESLSGGIITARNSECGQSHEGGNTRSSNIWRPSEHSIMRWIGFDYDQIGREHMTTRISGRRNSGQMALANTPTGQVGASDILWVETQHPMYHELDVVWSVNGTPLVGTNNARSLPLGSLGLVAGDVVNVRVSDPTDFVRDPALKNGGRLTQTRTWTIGTPLAGGPVTPAFGLHTRTETPIGGQDVVYVETTHPTDRVLGVTWRLDGNVVSPAHDRNFPLGAQGLTAGTHSLTASLTDPAAGGAEIETLVWTVDNVLPTAPRELSPSLVTLSGALEHEVYFGEFDMLLTPTDDQPGFVVGQFRLDHDGWFNWFGFPEQPLGTPFHFSHSGSDVKALTYGNLGTGGLSKATWEQTRPEYGFEPGYGTHTVEHRAIDSAGNVGNAGEYRATVLPGASPACTTTLTGARAGRLIVTSGVTCLATGSSMNGGVTVRPGASLVVAKGATINGGLQANGSAVIHVFGARVNGDSLISGITGDLILAGVAFHGSLTVSGSNSADVTTINGNLRDYGVALVGNSVTQNLTCFDNVPGVTNFGAPNSVAGTASGQCSGI